MAELKPTKTKTGMLDDNKKIINNNNRKLKIKI